MKALFALFLTLLSTMPAPDPAPSPEVIFEAIRGDLEPYVEGTLRGKLSVAADPFEVTELLGEAPGRFRVILSWKGEKLVSHPRSRVVEHRISAVVSHNRGLALIRGDHRSVKRGDDAPLMKLARQVRDRLMTISFLPTTDTEGQIKYEGCEPFAVEIAGNSIAQIDAFELTFTLVAAGARFDPAQFRTVNLTA